MKKDSLHLESSDVLKTHHRKKFPKTSSEAFSRLAEQAEGAAVLEGLHEADAAFVFSGLFRFSSCSYLWLCRDNRQAEQIAENLKFFLPAQGKDQVLLIPGAESDPYRGLSYHPEIAVRRALSLWKLLKGHQGFVVTTMECFTSRIPSPVEFLNNCFQLEVGNFMPLTHLVRRLRENGYVRDDPVSELGEFSNRGGIVDIFLPTHKNPVRIEFFGDEIDSIREFNSSTQRSIAHLTSCEVVPMREMIISDRDIERWQEKAPEHWNQIRFAEALTEKLQFTENGELFNGFEYVFPLVVNNEYSLLDFFSAGSNLRLVVSEAEELLEEIIETQKKRKASFEEQDGIGEMALHPEKLFFDKEWITDQLHEHRVFHLEGLAQQTHTTEHFGFQKERSYRGQIKDLLKDLKDWMRTGERVIFVMRSSGMAERLIDILKEYEILAHISDKDFDDIFSRPLTVTYGKLSQGFYSPSLGCHLLTQENVFQRRQGRPAPKKFLKSNDRKVFFSDLVDLGEGDYVVHVNHGVGVFRGLKKMNIAGQVGEFVVVQYRGGDKLYVPVDSVDQIQKYSGVGADRPQTHRLGGVSWERTKSRIKKSVRHLAEDLLKLYARREMAKGNIFSGDDFLIREFEGAFEYEETPDQLGAIQDVKADMESVRPMDRLICGDAGYGKTEVAMRAAFKAAVDSKQVALLCPTTILAFQHLRTFRERFQGFPIKIEMLSRLQTRQEQTDIIQRMSVGSIDILIGTHRILSKDVYFKDLGLVVLDEEQRFGVAQKEKFKHFRANVDVLSLSATPIPRTLNMSLTGLRDLSIIETPPKDRLAVQTVVTKFSKNIIRSAIDLELKRQGQILFLHNSIETIHSTVQMVRAMIPEARVTFAHGQMREKELEKVMLDFLDYRQDVLVATTIVENGLDIPRANTLIVNRADRFGLAQLYQLRGRVGRSSQRAYAYFLIPSEETLSQNARKRLTAIREFSNLGSGFRLAALDLEIRGAGNLLGSEQHGQINAVGFEFYLKLLEQTIEELKGKPITDKVQTSIDLHLDIQIPEYYIEDSHLRLWLYKRVSSVSDLFALNSLKEEITDRFGQYPSSVFNLLGYAQLRLRTRELKIVSLERKGTQVCLKFRDDTPVSRSDIVELVSQTHNHLSLTPEGVLLAEMSFVDKSKIFERVHGLLDEIAVLR